MDDRKMKQLPSFVGTFFCRLFFCQNAFKHASLFISPVTSPTLIHKCARMNRSFSRCNTQEPADSVASRCEPLWIAAQSGPVAALLGNGWLFGQFGEKSCYGVGAKSTGEIFRATPSRTARAALSG